jgi:hypothetical protein
LYSSIARASSDVDLVALLRRTDLLAPTPIFVVTPLHEERHFDGELPPSVACII